MSSDEAKRDLSPCGESGGLDNHHKPGMRSRKKNVAKNNLPTDSSLLDYAYIDGSKNESSASVEGELGRMGRQRRKMGRDFKEAYEP
ncbi:hypothetical protein NC652_031136 [Populus alba x Populus x berolinensis]|nr:hypothetical protein NC652_031136 [Populus alba x Populus x berolinensis]